MSFKLKKIKLDLKVNWKISRNESLFKENFILSYKGFESEIAPNIRYHETVEVITENFNELLLTNTYNPNWCHSFQNAYLNLLLKDKSNNDIYSYLNLEKLEFIETSFSIPIMDVHEIKNYLATNFDYSSYKIKIKDLTSIDLIHEIHKYSDKALRIDANEGFLSLDEYLKFEERIKNYNIEFIEQPFPKSHVQDYIALKKKSKFKIFADESIEDDFDAKLLVDQFHGVNIKLMKARGIENAKELLLSAKAVGMDTMIGCMIETSLGISEAYTLASLCDYCDLDGALLLQDDPYEDYFNREGSKLFLQ